MLLKVKNEIYVFIKINKDDLIPKNIIMHPIEIDFDKVNLIKFYFDYPEDFKVKFFGKIKESDFNINKIKNLKLLKFTKVINYNNMINKMNTNKSYIAINIKEIILKENFGLRSFNTIKDLELLNIKNYEI